MKKIVLSFVAIGSFCLASAQMKEKGVIEITPKIGSSSFAEYNEDNDGTDYNSGVEFGATIDYYFNNRWSLRSGLIFDKMGGEYSFNGDNYEDKLNYVSIPINANWHFGSTRKWNLNFGFSPSFLTNAEVEINGNTIKMNKNQIESFQLGLTFGIGYKIEVNNRFGILIDGQWFNGLTNFSKIAESGKLTNHGFSLNLGGVIQL
ncbi:porin family protein [Flavobacterium sp. MAHUQ-51]|uniref:porin family protein n=1 Tax=Flavobacterium sp. GCM10022190 TaxID=3252639 RepID=UPI00361F5D8E